MMRVGTGFDVHRLVDGRRLFLGGVEIPHPQGLEGHSDADVLMHAVCDALLGAAALGDIGTHFPDSDPKWEGASGTELLSAVVAKLAGEGWGVGNVDCTVLAEGPLIAPHSKAMRGNIAACCGTGAGSVSVKATTLEGLGFVGRREGIAAQAVVTILKGD